MPTLVQISGKPATGKSASIRFLDPKKTYVIDADEKGLSWAGWTKDYNAESKNYAKISEPSKVYQLVKAIHDNRPEVTAIVIDTINTMMSNEEVDILKHPNRDAWKDLATDVYDLYRLIRQLSRQDLVVFVMAHIEPYDVNGVTHWRTMTNGKKLSKLNLNSFLVYNLYTKVNYQPTGQVEYKLVTQSDGTTEARALMGVFEPEIENNLEAVRSSVMKAIN